MFSTYAFAYDGSIENSLQYDKILFSYQAIATTVLNNDLKNKEKENKIAWIKEQRESIEAWRNQKAPSVYNQINPDGQQLLKEKWTNDSQELDKKAEEALEYLNELEKELE